MEKRQLADELRQRQYKTGMVERKLIDALSDDQIIEAYVTCSDCGKKQVNAQQEAAALSRATNADEFFALCDKVAGAHQH